MKKVLQYLKGVSVELKRVRWPKLDEMVRYTVTVVSFVIFLGAFFYLVTFSVTALKYFINTLIK